MTEPLLHAHLENLSSKPSVFHLSRKLINEARRTNSDLAKRVRFTFGEDFGNLERYLSTAQVLVTSNDVLRDARFPMRKIATVAPNLKLVQVIGAGIERLLPLDWLPRSAKLATASGVHVDKARESLTMALLALNARLPEIMWNQRHARWDMIFTPLIRGKTLLVIGLGDIGRAAVEAGRALGLNVIGIRRSGGAMTGVDKVFQPKDLARVVGRADFIVVATPLTPDTHSLVSRDVLRRAKRGVALINVARAGVVDYEALRGLLKSGHVSGALLDVFDPEPLPKTSKLWSTPNLIMTPHVTSDDRDGYMREVIRLVCRNLRRMIEGRALENVVRPDRGY